MACYASSLAASPLQMFASERECREWLERAPSPPTSAESVHNTPLHTLAVISTLLPQLRQKQLRNLTAQLPKLFSYSPGKIKGVEG